MSDASTNRMLPLYQEEAPKPLFLSANFKSPPENFHNTEKVEVDIDRDNEEVALALNSVSDGYRENEFTKFVNKSYTPPVFKESGTVHATDGLKRVEGRTPFQDPDFMADAMFKIFRIARKLDNKVRRAIELMASQVLTTGILTFKDPNNVSTTLSFLPKGTHFVTPTAWAAGGASGDPITDIASLSAVIRRDGKQIPDKLIFGTTAWLRFLENAKVQAYLNKFGMNLGALGPVVAPNVSGADSATYQGSIIIANYRYEIWTYDGFYKDPISGTLTAYLPDNKVIMMCTKGRLDLSFGLIPRILPPDPRVAGLVPERLSDSATGLDMFMNVYPDASGEHIKVGLGCRPLTIPTAIDTFGCITAF